MRGSSRRSGSTSGWALSESVFTTSLPLGASWIVAAVLLPVWRTRRSPRRLEGVRMAAASASVSVSVMRNARSSSCDRVLRSAGSPSPSSISTALSCLVFMIELPEGADRSRNPSSNATYRETRMLWRRSGSRAVGGFIGAFPAAHEYNLGASCNARIMATALPWRGRSAARALATPVLKAAAENADSLAEEDDHAWQARFLTWYARRAGSAAHRFEET